MRERERERDREREKDRQINIYIFYIYIYRGRERLLKMIITRHGGGGSDMQRAFTFVSSEFGAHIKLAFFIKK